MEVSSSSPPPPPVFYFPPDYPSPSSSSSSNFPILAIAIIGILATAFLLVSYYIFVIKCCLNWHRIDILHRFSLSPPPHQSSTQSDFPHHHHQSPDKGLDEALIRLIPVIKFRKLDRGITGREEDTAAAEPQQQEHMECAVCLSEFKQGEKLRVIPNCCHAFHIDCIDVWLQSNANCPLCRCTISLESLSSIDIGQFSPLTTTTTTAAAGNLNPIPVSSTDQQDSDDDDDYVVIEIQGNNLDQPRLISRRDTQESNTDSDEHPTTWSINLHDKPTYHSKVKSVDDECVDMMKKKKNEAKNDNDTSKGSSRVVQPFRRSISLDLTSQRQLWSEVREIMAEQKEQVYDDHCFGISGSSSGGGGGGSGRGVMRRSFFSFGSGKGGSSKSAVLPL